MASYLDSLTEYTSKAQVVIADLAVAAADLILTGGDPQTEIDQINWYSLLLTGANDTTQNEELRLVLLTLLVDNARLNEVPLVNVFGLYQTLADPTITATQWGLITGNINDQADLIARFGLYLPLAGGTMTGNITFGDGLGIDVFNEGDTLNIGASAGDIQFGPDSVAKFNIIGEGAWNGSVIGVAYGGTGINSLTGQAGKALVVNGGATGFTFATIPSTAGFLPLSGGTMTGQIEFEDTFGIDTVSGGGTLSIGGNATIVQFNSDIEAGNINQGTWLGSNIALNKGGTGQSLSDPGFNAVMVWDNTTNTIRLAELQASLAYSSFTNRLGVAGTLSNITITGASNWQGNVIGVVYGGTGLNALGTANQYLKVNSGGTALEYATLTALTNPMSAVGDIIYGGVAGAATRLAGNTTTTKQFLTQTGSGGSSNAPSWGSIAAGDLPIVTLVKGGLGAAFSDPNANRLLGWDDATSAMSFIVIGSGLTYDAGTKTLSVSASGIVASVTGTANRITSTGGSNPVIDISASYAGQSSISVVGTLTSGTWQGALIDGAFGGTGLDVTTLNPGDSIRVNGTGTAWETYTPGGGGTPGGSNTQLQYNNSGAFGGITGATTNGTNVTFGSGNLLVTDVKASGSGGITLQNASGGTLLISGAGGGTGTSIAGTTNIASASADYFQIAGGTGTITQTATGSSTNITINMVPKGSGELQYGGVEVAKVTDIASFSQAFTSVTSVTVTHNLGRYPLVQAINSGGFVFSPSNIEHTSTNVFTVTFAASSTGNILYF